jgi:hypothetical protein
MSDKCPHGKSLDQDCAVCEKMDKSQTKRERYIKELEAMNEQTIELLKQIARFDSPAKIEWRGEAQEILLDALEGEHADEPPNECPICGAALGKEIDHEHWVEVYRCWECNWVDEWDGPADNPAEIRY